MALFVRTTRAIIQSFAGDPGNFLGRTLEWPWYGFWTQAFYGEVDPRTVNVGPQSEVVKRQRTNDGRVVLRKRVPDFVLHYATGVPLDHDIGSLLEVTNHEQLQQFYQGRCIVTKSLVLAICEVKPYPDPNVIPAGDQFRDKLAKALGAIQAEARAGAKNQAALYLASRRNISCVVAISTFGAYFSWKVFVQGGVSDVSSNLDATYRDSGGASEESSADQAASVKYGQYPLPRKETAKEGPNTSEDEGDEDDAPLTMQKVTGKGKAVAKPEEKTEGDVKNRRVDEHKDKGKGKGNEVQSRPAPEMPLLELPPLLDFSEDTLEEVIASSAPAAEELKSTTSSPGPETASTSANTSGAARGDLEQPNADSDHGDEEDTEDIPPAELEWSQWYHWDTANGIRERTKMLKAIQRQHPDLQIRRQ
ncbi:uncharacterized protein B0H18DRAFT_1118653 [Fomitopsis serialis]|uniref:uncharacterized protein n=1 Tax=Fomitopsis serialis TaxID=139415 RepID=UPI00200784A8|nr:uncharacterized protein B0H18DRAFT_1118653 [Neoantrodia serialis]KAH9926891.1 hypothetical protein B0H18DRAFT_1118653 [Neoantrodia serialis]